MSLLGYDLDRVGAPIREVAVVLKDAVKAYRERTKVVSQQIDAMNRIAAALERENE